MKLLIKYENGRKNIHFKKNLEGDVVCDSFRGESVALFIVLRFKSNSTRSLCY
jgi:hypothetical protein